jgi:hypothetical protein
LPADPAVLEAQRRKQLLAFWQGNARQPQVFTPEMVTDWLQRLGASSVGELLARGAAMPAAAQMQIVLSNPQAQAPELKAMPVCVAILIRDAPLDVAALLADSRRTRELLREQGAERPPNQAEIGQVPVVVAWVVPGEVFDDADWPGGSADAASEQNNAQRRLAASRWLAREAIALVIPPPRVS